MSPTLSVHSAALILQETDIILICKFGYVKIHLMKGRVNMIDAIFNLDTWTIVSGILGVLGFIISAINIIRSLLNKRIDLEISILNYEIRDYIDGMILIKTKYQVTNNSHLPISITDFSIIINNERIPVDRKTHTVGVYQYTENNIVVDRVPQYNSLTPINLPGLSSEIGDFVYATPKGTVPDFQNGMLFEIRSNRRKAVKMRLAPKVFYRIRRRKILRVNYQNRQDQQSPNV